LGRDEIGDELHKIADEIRDYLDILGSRERIRSIIKDELTEVRELFATPRRTEITESDADFEDEDLIQREDMVVTVSHAGYIKRVPLSTYRAQRRGGKGRSGMSTRDEDFVTRIFVASTHTPVLFFSSSGQVYREKVWRLPLSAPQARGKALVNILPLSQGELITSILPLPEDEETWANLDVVFCTNVGSVRRNKLSDFQRINRNGKIAMKLDEGMSILSVDVCTDQDDLLLTTAMGQAIRFPVGDLSVFQSRDSTGVRGINLAEGDEVIGMSVLRHYEATPAQRAAYIKRRRLMEGEVDDMPMEDEESDGSAAELTEADYVAMSAAEEFILAISEKGYGKRSSSFEYRVSGRGGKGITAMAVTPRNGPIVASFPVEHTDQIMIVSNNGQLIRVPVDGIRIAGRATQGVTIFNVGADDRVVSVERISEPEDEAGDVLESDSEDEPPTPPQEG
jgi:DNA gyrase subunit A